MLFIFFCKVMSWMLLFHLLFWCHKIIFRETSSITVFENVSQYWEKIKNFVDILLKKTAHVQQGTVRESHGTLDETVYGESSVKLSR